MHRLIKYVEGNGMSGALDIKASFCFEQFSKGPSITIDDNVINRCDFETACKAINLKIDQIKTPAA